MLRRLIGEDIRVSVSLDPRIGNIRADRNQIEQVIMNLAVNARDAMPNGGELTISTRRYFATAGEGAHAPGQYAMLSVRDTGHGFDAETKAKIFEPFFTTKEKGKGTGLGLSTVYGIVQQSDGQITVQSELGRGSEFCIQLPCVNEDRHESDAKTSNDIAVSASGKILLVEDEQAVRELALRLLKQAGYTVISPKEPSDALRLSKSELNSIDLVVTDVVMPGMNGPELVAHLLTRRPDLKVLYMSGYNDHPLFRAGVLSDRATLLQKPFSRTDLLAKVRSVLPAALCADARS
jgi:CheY-like chemotaxis protein